MVGNPGEKRLTSCREQSVHGVVVIDNAILRSNAMNPADDPARDAESSARQALNHARSAMERTLAELDRYIVRY